MWVTGTQALELLLGDLARSWSQEAELGIGPSALVSSLLGQAPTPLCAIVNVLCALGYEHTSKLVGNQIKVCFGLKILKSVHSLIGVWSFHG